MHPGTYITLKVVDSEQYITMLNNTFSGGMTALSVSHLNLISRHELCFMKIKVEHVPVDLHGTQYRMCRFFKNFYSGI